jgi:hypothetical protein
MRCSPEANSLVYDRWFGQNDLAQMYVGHSLAVHPAWALERAANAACGAWSLENMRRRASRRWTQEEIAQLRKLAARHPRVTVIARELGRSVNSVQTRATLEGINLTDSGRQLLAQWWPAVEAFRAARTVEADRQDVGTWVA